MPFPTPRWLRSCAVFLLLEGSAVAQTTTNAFALRAQQAFAEAQREYAAHPDAADVAWHLGRATYDWAEFATNAEQRGAVARVGIAACQHLIAANPQSAAGHYYLGMDLGELAEAQAPSLSAYHLIREIEREFKTAADLDERFDFAGPLRCLGLLYRDAPGWPLSIGSRHKAREYLDRAAAVAPDFPENLMNLVESNVQWRDETEAEQAWKKLAALWSEARTKLAGPGWDPSWADWTARRTAARAEFEKAFKHTPEP